MGGPVKGEFLASGNNSSLTRSPIAKKNISINKCDAANREYLSKTIYIDARLTAWVTKLLSYFPCLLLPNKAKQHMLKGFLCAKTKVLILPIGFKIKTFISTTVLFRIRRSHTEDLKNKQTYNGFVNVTPRSSLANFFSSLSGACSQPNRLLWAHWLYRSPAINFTTHVAFSFTSALGVANKASKTFGLKNFLPNFTGLADLAVWFFFFCGYVRLAASIFLQG